MLVASVGNFGERWLKLTPGWGANVTALEYEWGTKADPADVAAALAEEPGIKAVFVQFSETSTGVVNDIKAIGEIVAKTPAMLVVDAITRPRRHRPAHRRVARRRVRGRLAEGAHGAAGPGLVAGQREGLEGRRAVRHAALLLRLGRDAQEDDGDSAQTPYTPAVTLMVAQNKAIEMIREEGLQNVFERHRVLGRACKEGVKALGLELFGPDDPEANSVTAVKVPEGVDGGKIGKLARDKYGVWLAGGQGTAQGQDLPLRPLRLLRRLRHHHRPRAPSRWCSPSSATTSSAAPGGRRRASVHEERGQL